MKKLIMFCMAVVLIVMAGCSQTSNTTVAGEGTQSKVEYPTKPIEIIVPFAPGGSTDIGARILEKYLPKYLPDAQIVIVNKPGGSGTIAISEVFNAKPDGYKLALSTHRAIATQPLYGKTKYSHESFQPIAKVFGNQQIMVVRGDAPWETFEEWIEYVKDNPGEFTFGVAGGIGSGAHLPMAELEMVAGLKAKPVPFEGTPPTITGVLGGHVQGAVLQPSDAKALIDSGELRAIFNAGSIPVPYYPDVPLLKDEGYDIVYDSNTSLIAPKDVPEEIVTLLQEALKKTMEDPEVIEEFEKVNLQVQYGTAEVVQEELDEENSKTEAVLKEIKLIK